MSHVPGIPLQVLINICTRVSTRVWKIYRVRRKGRVWEKRAQTQANHVSCIPDPQEDNYDDIDDDDDNHGKRQTSPKKPCDITANKSLYFSFLKITLSNSDDSFLPVNLILVKPRLFNTIIVITALSVLLYRIMFLLAGKMIQTHGSKYRQKEKEKSEVTLKFGDPTYPWNVLLYVILKAFGRQTCRKSYIISAMENFPSFMLGILHSCFLPPALCLRSAAPFEPAPLLSSPRVFFVFVDVYPGTSFFIQSRGASYHITSHFTGDE